MRTERIWIVAVAGLLLACALGLSCASDDEVEQDAEGSADDAAAADAGQRHSALHATLPEVVELIVEGKAALCERDGQTAHEKFLRALVFDADNSDAACGLMLADGIIVLDTLAALPGQLEDPAMPEKAGGMGDNAQRLVEQMLLPPLREMQWAIKLTQADPAFNFWLEHYPIWLDGDHALIDMGQEWDAADMIAARGLVYLLMGMSDTLLSLEADFEWSTVFNWDFGFGGDTTELIVSICDLFISLLTDDNYPDFLKLNEDGDWRLPQAGIELGRSLRDLGRYFDLVRAETDDQRDDVTGYADLNGNAAWDAGEPMIIPYAGQLSEGGDITWNLLQHYSLGIGASFLDGTDEDIDPENPDKWNVNELNMLIFNIGLGFVLPEMEIDFGQFFRDAQPDGLHTTLLLAATFIKEALEADGGSR